MNKPITLIVSTGVYGESRPEEILNRGLEANTFDILDRTKSASSIRKQVLITNSSHLLDLDKSMYPKLSVKKTTEDFHFGRSLFDQINRHQLEKVFYLGGGSGPLFRKKDFEKIFKFIENHATRSISNNFYSTDMIGLGSASRLLDFDPPQEDNELGWLSRDADLTPYELRRSAKTQLDMDSPVDLLSIKLGGSHQGKLSEHISTLDWGNTRIREILPQFTDQSCRLVIAGRIGASTWSHLEREAACQIDVYSEGRGSGARRKENGLPASPVGSLFEDKGPGEFLKHLTAGATGLFLDTRVLMDYFGEWPSRADRFSSDLLEPQGVDTPYLKELTEAALNAAKPVVLGGHSMVSGALYLFSNVSWSMTEPESVNIRPETYELNNTK